MTADALATAFMVMGLKTEAFANTNPAIDACLYTAGENGSSKHSSEGMKII